MTVLGETMMEWGAGFDTFEHLDEFDYASPSNEKEFKESN